MMALPTIIDYIAVHELCHFHHLDHTDAFWNEVDKVMPNYRMGNIANHLDIYL
jgi:predicted metal-dependent hydrolase